MLENLYTYESAINDLAKRYGKRHGVLAASGSSALEAALVMLGLGPGDAVLVPDSCCYKIPAAVSRVGATPVFVQVDRSLVLTPEAVTGALAADVRCVVAVHQYGLPCPVAAVRETLPSSVRVIEDVSQAWDAVTRGEKVGTIGDCTITSFGARKPIAVGAGGGLFGDHCRISDVLDRGETSQRSRPIIPLLAPFPKPLLPALRRALAAAQGVVNSQRRFAETINAAMLAAGFETWHGRLGDQASWHRIPVWASSERLRRRLLELSGSHGVKVQTEHAERNSELPMFKGHGRIGGLHIDKDDSLLLICPPYPDTADRLGGMPIATGHVR
jgi:perosamine synthetase